MLQVHTCVSVHCDQCGDTLGSPEFEAHYRTERSALSAATAQRWRFGSRRRLLCSACAPVLTCEAQGHEFSQWRHPVTADGHPALSEYRYCRRCCRNDSRPATTHQDHQGGGEPR